MKTNKQAHYSYYRIVLYAQCPFRYHEELINKTQTEVDDLAIEGRALHDILRSYSLACLKAKKTHLFDKWKGIAHKVLRSYSISSSLENSIMTAAHDYVSSNEVELDDLAGIEEEIAISKDLKPVRWDKGWFRAKIDKLYIRDNYCKIVDYKTGYAMEINPFQLEIYTWVVSKAYPQINVFQIEFDFTRHHYRRMWELTRENDLKAIEEKILNRIQQIEEDKEFKPTIGSQCETCHVWHKCPAIKTNKSYQSIVPRNKKQASMLLGVILSKQKEIKELKELLTHFVEREGDIVFNDMVATNHPTTSTKWDIVGLLTWANKKGYQIIDALNVDNRRIKRALPADTVIPESLYSVFIDTEVEIKKVKQEKKSLKKERTYGRNHPAL